MDYKNKEIIINRFNDAIRYIAAMQKAISNENRSVEVEQKRNAGEALSCAYEWSIKHHLFHYALNIQQDWKDCDFFSNNIKWRDLIDTLKGRNKAQPFSSLLPNFQNLYDDKRDGRNISTHSGKEPIEDNIYSFAEEVRKLILAYVDINATLNHVEEYIDFNATAWESLYSTCNRFERIDNNYILIVGDLKSQPVPYKKYLGTLPWNLIIDFDQTSKEENGFFDSCYSQKPVQPQIIKITDKDLGIEFFPIAPKAHFHYFVKGYLGDGVNINPDIKWSVWNERNSQNLSDNFQKTLAAFASKYPSTTKVIIFHEDVAFVAGICGILNRVFSQRIEFIICSTNNRLADRIIEEDGYNGKHIPISFSELSTGISLFHKEFDIENFFDDSYRLPHNKNTKTQNVNGLFSIDEMADFDEDMEVLHLDILKKVEIEERLDFLKGKMPLSWYGANLKDPFDVKHPKLKSILKDVQDKDKKGIYFLKHEPGVGGTTFVRRLAWDLHEISPTVILKDFRDADRVMKKIEKIYERTRERIYIIANVPQAISTDNLRDFEIRLKAKPWSYLVIAVGRDLPKNNSMLINWGDNCIELINEFKRYLPDLSYSDEIIQRKQKELDLIYNGREVYKKTPFYIGFLVSEENFFAVDSYIKNFIDSLRTNEQKKIIKYLSLVQDYLGLSLPTVFFSKLLHSSENKSIGKLTDILPLNFDHVLSSSTNGNLTFWTTRHPLFAKKFKEILLKGSSPQEYAWKENLPDLCIEFIEDSNITGEQSTYIQDEILQPLFIGSRIQRGGNAFSTLVEEMNPEAQESVFLKLAETYPDNAHYCSHLARFYAYIKKNSEKALEFADKAIRLAEQNGRKDALLYHIRGMCYRQSAKTKMDIISDSKRNNRPYFPEQVDEIIYGLVPKAAREFQETRKIQRNSEYGYIAHIQMLIWSIDFGHILSGLTKSEFLSAEKEPYAEWLDEAATLLEEVKRLTIGEDSSENEKITQCDDDLNALYEKYDLVIQNLNNQLDKGKNPERVRRQITRFMIKKQPDYGKDSNSVRRIMELMAENIKNEPEKEGNFYLWFQAARHSSIKISDAIDKMARWKAKSTTLDAAYYFYVLKVIRAIEGYSDEMAEAVKLIQESRQKSRTLPNNTYCHEWYGFNNEMRRLISGKEVYGGYWDDKCEPVRGIITEFLNDGNGKITLKNANLLDVFFNPSETNISEDYLNREVEFYLGFSYDGLRAKNVQPAGKVNRRISLHTKSTNSLESVAHNANDIVSKLNFETQKIDVQGNKGNKKDNINNNIVKQEKSFKGEVKIKKFSEGYIKCTELDKDIAFSRIHLKDCDMVDLNIGTVVEVKIKLENSQLQTTTNRNNYKASEVQLLPK